MEILGLSLVTNLAAGMGGEELNHQEVLDAGRDAGPRISALLAEIVKGM
jgi:purine-nucleoside phosphorylase